MRSKMIRPILKDIVLRFMKDDLISTGAQITFYLFLSLFPFLIFFITLISYTHILEVKNNLQILSSIMPTNAYEILSNMITETINSRSGELLSFGMLFTLWTSSNGVTALIGGINKAYKQKETRSFIRIIAISLFFTLELTIVIIFSFIFIVFGNHLSTFLSTILGSSSLFLLIISNIRYIIAFVAIILVFLSLYCNTPNIQVSMKDAFPGALVAAIGWIIISTAFSYYADNFGNYSKVYGSLGGMIVLLTWIHLSSIIILIGAELNASLRLFKLNAEKPR